MLQTVMPMAILYNLNISTSFGVDEADLLAKNGKTNTETVLIVYEHNQLNHIAKSLGVKMNDLKWSAEDCDGIWVITFNNGKAVLHKDQEGIKPALTCSFNF